MSVFHWDKVSSALDLLESSAYALRLYKHNISTPRTVQGYPWGGGTSTFMTVDDIVPSVFATLSHQTPGTDVAPP
jgi:hypothetical protein